MKHTLSTLVCLLFCYGLIHAQQVVFKERHKLLEYSYAVVDSIGMQRLNDIEKVKYQLKFQEKTKQFTIFDNNETLTELSIDSNTHGEEWIKWVKKYRYTSKQTEFIGANGEVLKIIPNSKEEMSWRQMQKKEIDSAGYHPGLISFPNFRALLGTNTDSLGFQISVLSPNEIQVRFPTSTLIIDDKLYTITEDFTGKDGIRTRVLHAYEPYMNQMGFLLKLKKEERFLTGYLGACITETKLSYYTHYEIQDFGNLMQKSLGYTGQIKVYPNPNAGVFTAELIIPDSKKAHSGKLISVQSGTIIPIDVGNNSSFLVNQPNLPMGNYVLQVLLTNGQVLSVSFVKN